MENDVYQKLADRLNSFEHVVQQVPSYFELLREFYTEEQAEFASNFPEGQFFLNDLASFFGTEEEELKKTLESMAREGLVFVTFDKETNEKKYELSPWMVGVIEFSIVRRMDNSEKSKKVTAILRKMLEEQQKLLEPHLDHLDELYETLPSEHVRVLTIDEAIPDKSGVLTHENVIQLVEKETSFAAMRCCCRHNKSNLDDPCKCETIPEYSCLFFGVVADYISEYGMGKRLTKEEAIETLKICSKAGCVHNTNNFTEALQFICNCCPCCCGFLDIIRNFGNIKSVNTSNFICLVNKDTCTVCGECVERCPVNAIKIANDLACVNESICLGCGNCVTECPTESLSMVRISNKQPVVGERKIGMGY